MAHTMSVCNQCGGINRVDSQKALLKKPSCGRCKAELPMHGLVSELSEQGFRKLLEKADLPVIVDFWASWCGPCKMYGPVFERASSRMQDAIFVKINTEESPRLSSELGIRGIPTTIVFKGGREVRREAGLIPEALFPQLLT